MDVELWTRNSGDLGLLPPRPDEWDRFEDSFEFEDLRYWVTLGLEHVLRAVDARAT